MENTTATKTNKPRANKQHINIAALITLDPIQPDQKQNENITNHRMWKTKKKRTNTHTHSKGVNIKMEKLALDPPGKTSPNQIKTPAQQINTASRYYS